MNDINDFFAEQDRRMCMPDEDVEEYLKTRLQATRRNRLIEERAEIGVAPHSPMDSQRQYERASGLRTVGENSSTKRVDPNEGPNFASPQDLSSRPCSATAAVKRRRVMGDISIPKSTEHFLRASAFEGLESDPSTSRTAARRCGASIERFTGRIVADPIRNTMSRQTRSVTSNRNSPSSTTDLANATECCWGSIVPSQLVQTTDRAVPVTAEASGFSVQAIPSGSKGFSLPQVSSRDDTTIFDSTTFDGHERNSSGSVDISPPSSPAHGILTVSLTTIPAVAAPSSSRITSDSHGAGRVSEDQVSRTPAGFNTTAHIDVSNVTSPADTLSGHSHHDNRSSPMPSVAVHRSSSSPLVSKELKTRKTKSSRSGRASGNGRSSKQLKEKAKLITPLEYARKLQSCLNLHTKTSYLKGKRIFYVGGDMMFASTSTRGRMEYIVKHGGTLVPKYDPAIVTHIVTDAGVHHTLRALSLKSLSEIPENIPTVTWNWVISGYKRASKRKLNLDKGDKGKGEEEGDYGDENDPFDFEFMHAAFQERMDAGCRWQNIRHSKQGEKPTYDLAPGVNSGDISHISTFSQESKPTQTARRSVPLTVLPPPPLKFRPIYGDRVGVHVTPDTGVEKGKEAQEADDPLSEYYAQARAEREAKWNQDASDTEDEGNDFDDHREPAPKRGFACDIKGQKPNVCVNQHIVDKLVELMELHKTKSSEDDRWRTYSYGKCIPAIRNYPKPIRSFSEARAIRGVGEKTALKIMEIIHTGDLQRIKYENTEDVTATRMFQGIYGVGKDPLLSSLVDDAHLHSGRHTAFTWFASGLRTLDDVRARKGGLKLTIAQEIGLKFYDDINSRMPREEARRIFETIKPIALAIDSELFIEIMGSYRRGKADCGDIDILITRPTTDGKTHQGVLRTLLEQLHATGIITEDLAVPDDFSDLELIYRGLCKLPEPGAKRRRIDFLCVPWTSRGAALLYYTGDDIFNRSMRLKANRHGYSLNQRGLYADVLRDPRDRQHKVCEGHIVASETEQEIFDILGVPWQEPHERVRG